MGKLDPQVREREDGFWEVSGVAGYHSKADAIRVARQVGRGIRAGRANPDDRIDPRTTAPGDLFTDALDPDEAEKEEPEKEEPSHRRRASISAASLNEPLKSE
jgi:hypothetical protein